jgi:arylsulfatase
MPLHGESLLASLSADVPVERKKPQYFEMIGHRAIWKDGWKAVTFHDQGVSYDDDTWSLFDHSNDFSEMHDLATKEPDRLKEMVETWWEEARRFGVLPLDDRGVELFGAKPRPGSPHYGTTYTYYPPIAHIPSMSTWK